MPRGVALRRAYVATDFPLFSCLPVRLSLDKALVIPSDGGGFSLLLYGSLLFQPCYLLGGLVPDHKVTVPPLELRKVLSFSTIVLSLEGGASPPLKGPVGGRGPSDSLAPTSRHPLLTALVKP